MEKSYYFDIYRLTSTWVDGVTVVDPGGDWEYIDCIEADTVEAAKSLALAKYNGDNYHLSGPYTV